MKPFSIRWSTWSLLKYYFILLNLKFEFHLFRFRFIIKKNLNIINEEKFPGSGDSFTKKVWLELVWSECFVLIMSKWKFQSLTLIPVTVKGFVNIVVPSKDPRTVRQDINSLWRTWYKFRRQRKGFKYVVWIDESNSFPIIGVKYLGWKKRNECSKT